MNSSQSLVTAGTDAMRLARIGWQVIISNYPFDLCPVVLFGFSAISCAFLTGSQRRSWLALCMVR